MPSAIIDHWLEVFALMVARVGRNPREAYQSFLNIVLEASAASPTFSEDNFIEMMRHDAVPIQAQAVAQPPAPAKVPPFPTPPKPALAAPLKKVASLPLKPQILTAPAESRVQKLSSRLDALVTCIKRLKERHNSNNVNAPTTQQTNDPLPGAIATSDWEAEDLENHDLSLDALEKRAAHLTKQKF